jgi:hypothetical protein
MTPMAQIFRDLDWGERDGYPQISAMAQISENILKDHEATIAPEYPGQRGFTRQNLFRMRQFFEGYQGYAKVSALRRQLPWNHPLILLSQRKKV